MITKNLKRIEKELKRVSSKEKAKILQRFFKTGPGEYGEGDVFLGVVVPDIRKLSKAHKNIPYSNILKLLKSPIHEKRLLALLILVLRFEESDKKNKKFIYELYLKNTKYINNWDLVDLTAHHIVGGFLTERSRNPLYKLAKSKSLWERRIAVLSTFHFIRRHQFEDTFKIAEILLNDTEDLIHKAVGWMLREAGNRNLNAEEHFLKKHYREMPRTMLRYAIEKFPEAKRQAYLKSKI